MQAVPWHLTNRGTGICDGNTGTKQFEIRSEDRQEGSRSCSSGHADQDLYFAVELDYTPDSEAGDSFRVRVPEVSTPGWFTNSIWDPYNLREAFLQLRREEASDFLNVVGQFRYKRRWSSKPVSVAVFTSGIHRSGFPSWDFEIGNTGAVSISTSSLPTWAALLSRSGPCRTRPWMAQDTSGSIQRQRYLSREETERIFSSPGARIPGSRVWHYAQTVLKRQRADRAWGNKEAKQKLIAEVTPATALDAILATVLVDKLRGLELQVCALQECNATFESHLNHGKKYWKQYHAHLDNLRSRRAEAKERKLKKLRKKEKAK